MRNTHTRLVLVLSIALFGSILARLPGRQWSPGAHASASSFEERINEYCALRRRVLDELLRSRRDVGDVGEAAFRDRLASGIRDERRGARTGDVFGADFAVEIAGVVQRALSGRPATDRQAILAEVPVAAHARVNDFYPDNAPLATVPPLLLARLAPLPPELQYRFLEDALILIDVDTNLIIDVIPNALGRRS
jgi:hypothetical protein